MKKTNYIYALMALVAMVWLASCGGKASGEASAQDSLPKYELITLEAVNTEVTYHFPAVLSGDTDIDIYPQTDGRITGVFFETGSFVQKGQKLYTIDDSEEQMEVSTLRASVKSAEAVVNSAKLKLDSQKKLFEKNIVSEFVYRTAENEYSTAQAQLAQAQAQLNIAMTKLGFCTVTSPITGIANKKNYKVGELVGSTMEKPLTTVSDQSKIMAKFSIPETAFAAVIAENNLVNTPEGYRPKDKSQQLDGIFNLVMSNGEKYEEKGKFVTMSGIVDNQTGTAMCYVKYPNPNGILHSGSSATVVVPVEMNNAIIVPQSACKKLQDKYLLYKVGKDGLSESVIVDVYPTDDGKNYIVTDGKLKSGDIILATGVARMMDGMQLK